MPQSLSKVYVHIIFSTKNRQDLIDDSIESSLYEYLGGICKGLECNPVKVGGHKNHVHVLCLLSRKVAQMKLLEEIKKQSSKKYKVKYASPSASLAPPLKLQRHADGDRWMNDICGIRLTPFQDLDFCYTIFTGRCPVLLLMPFQGKKEDK